MVRSRLALSVLVLGLTIAGSPLASDLASGLIDKNEPTEITAAKETAEAAFVAQRYDEAMTIYRHTLAPAGDKYSQHMVGWMHLNGLGVPVDTVSGAAWIALSAQRGDRQLIALREEITSQLDAATLAEVRVRTQDLMATYGDCAVVSQSLLDDRKQIRGHATGSRLGPSETLRTTVIEIADDGRSSRRLKKDIERKERFLRKNCPAE